MTADMTRRAALAGLSVLSVAPAIAQTARPEGTITIVHGFTPGGNVDLTARLVAERLGARLSRQIVVEPKPGAGGTTAAAYVARATPDGSTLAILPGRTRGVGCDLQSSCHTGRWRISPGSRCCRIFPSCS